MRKSIGAGKSLFAKHVSMKASFFLSILCCAVIAMTAACPAPSKAGPGLRPTSLRMVYRQAVSRLYVGQVQKNLTERDKKDAPLQAPQSPPPGMEDGGRALMRKVVAPQPVEPDEREQAALPVADDAESIAEPPSRAESDTPAPGNSPAGFTAQGEAVLDVAQPLSVKQSAQAAPDRGEELVYDLPMEIFGQANQAEEETPAVAAAPGDRTKGDQTKGERQASIAGIESVISRQAAGGAERPPRALALYGRSASPEGGSLFGFKAKSGPGSGLTSVTSINRSIFAPLGMYQLATGSVYGEQLAPPGESRFTGTFDWQGLGIRPSAGVYWYSDQYTDYHFSPSPGEIRRDGFKERESLQDVSPFLGITLDMDLNSNWSAFINGEVSMPRSRVRENSRMDSHNESVTTGIIYTFH